MRILVILMLVAGLRASGAAVVHPSAATGPVKITPAFITLLAEEMRTNHPALRAVRERTAAAQSNVDSVRSWEDPMVRIGGMGARAGMRAEDGDIIYGVEQKLPILGKPKLARQVAQAELATVEADADYQHQQLRVELAKALLKTALADRIVEIRQHDLIWLDAIVRAAEHRYQAGTGSQVDVLRLQNERSKVANQLVTDQREGEHERLTINRLLNRDLQSAWPALALPHLAAPIAYNERLANLAAKFEPRLRKLRSETKQAEALVRLTRRQRLPDVSVGVEGRNYSGDGSFRQGAVLLGISIPWGNAGKYRSDIKREESRLKAAEFDVNAYELSVREDVHMMTVKIDAARREALLYRDEIIPRSETALESARAAWETGRFILTDVLEARRTLLEAQLMYARAVAGQYQTMVELVLCCGLGDLEALQMIGAGVSGAQPPQDK